MNPYLDHLLDLVEPDGSFTRESPGVVVTGYPDVELVAMIALIVEIHELREFLERAPQA